MPYNDEFISVDLINDVHILHAEGFQELHALHIEAVGPLTRRAKLAVPLEIVQADVKLGAVGGEPAGSMQTISLVVMWAYLQREIEG